MPDTADTRNDTLTLDAWMERQATVSAAKMAQAISATSLVLDRASFGQKIRPAKGSILASPEIEFGEKGPDYFFHWIRDAAVVMDAMLVPMAGAGAEAWIERFEDCVRFSLRLGRLNGPKFLHGNDFRAKVGSKFLQFVRPDTEIAAIEAERALDDVRYNADGTLDFIKWSRPQYDGAAAEALVALRFWEMNRSSNEGSRRELAQLIRRDLDYCCARTREPCFDIWEEELGHHYYTRLVQFAALERGARWMETAGDLHRARLFGDAATSLVRVLDGFWSAEQGLYRSRMPAASEAESPKALDVSVIFAIIHARRAAGPHSVGDERARATLTKIEALFAADYALNRGATRPFAIGRYKGDTYFSGGAYYFSTFAVAEFNYRAAAVTRARELVAEGDAILNATRRYIPDSGELSEQFDQTSGAQTSAKNLTWSYAAFLTACDARRRATNS